MIDGVCSGIADFFGTDPSAVRLALIAFTIMSVAVGIIFYLVAMMVMPAEPSSLSGPVEVQSERTLWGKERSHRKSLNSEILTGVAVLIVGIILLFHLFNISLMTSVPWRGFLDLGSIGRLALPVILILIGSILLMGREDEVPEKTKEGGSPQTDDSSRERAEPVGKQRLFRSVHDEKLMGICGGLGEYLGLDSTLVRMTFVLLVLATYGVALIVYVVFALVIPKENS